MKKTTVFIVDDHAILRMGLVSLLQRKDDIEVVGDTSSGEVAVRKVPKLKPDVIIMDLMMPKMDGTEATRQIIKANPDAKILVLTTFGTADGISKALQAGAIGAVLKSSNLSEVVEAIRAVARGEKYVSSDVKAIFAAEPPLPALTSRQAEILEAIIKGLTNKEIANNLGISLQMVKEHVRGIFTKIGANRRSEAAAIALRKHLLKM